MKKWIIGFIIMILAGIFPCIYAANDQPDIRAVKRPASPTASQQKQGAKNQEDEDQQRKKRERQEQERKDQERRDQERKEQERREQERRDQQRKEQERREQERRDQERREQERREQERRDQERREQERRELELREARRREWERWENEYRDVKFHGYWHRRNLPQEREDSRYIIRRTSEVISFAQRAALIRHYNSGLARAIAHQQRALELYEAHLYWSAIYHSLRARNLAMIIISRNREQWFEKSFAKDPREEKYRYNGPEDHVLDLLIDLKMIGSDDAVVNIHFELDIKD